MFKEIEEYEGISYLYYDDLLLSFDEYSERIILPLEILDKITFEELPWLDGFILPRFSGIISNKLQNQEVLINDNDDKTIIEVRVQQPTTVWRDSLSITSLYVELLKELEKSEKIELIGYSIKIEELNNPNLMVDYCDIRYQLSFDPATNIKDAYNYFNEMICEIELQVYKKVLDASVYNYVSYNTK